jgi:hypothetical protein
MLSYLYVTSASLAESNYYSTPPATKHTISIYLRPIIIAAGATVLLSVLVCFAFVTIANWFLIDDTARDVQQLQMLKEKPELLANDRLAQKENLKTFVNKLKSSYHTTFITTADGTYVTVRLAGPVLYRLHQESTYQELATQDEATCRQLMRQLDAQGIEAEVLKNTSSSVLLCDSEWLISWGGLLYLPKTEDSF